MRQKLSLLAVLLALLIICLPVYAAAKRARAQGTYAYRLTGTESIAGHTQPSRDNGTLTLSGTRINGSASDGESSFTMRLNKQVNQQAQQDLSATGTVVIRDSEGTSRGNLAANVRVQKTRTSQWKMVINYNGTVTKGPFKGGVLTGKLVAKSS